MTEQEFLPGIEKLKKEINGLHLANERVAVHVSRYSLQVVLVFPQFSLESSFTEMDGKLHNCMRVY